MTTDLEHRLRTDLRAVDAAPLDDSIAPAVGAAFRRRQTRRRAGLAVVSVAIIGAGVTGLAMAGRDADTVPATTPTVTTTARNTVPPVDAGDGWRVVEIAPDPRGDVDRPAAVWTGSQVISVAGTVGLGEDRSFVDGGSFYDPMANTWRLGSGPAGAARDPSDEWHLFETIEGWTGDEFVLLTATGTGAAYDPGNDTWRPIELEIVGKISEDTPHAWTGSEWLIWPGGGPPVAYDPAEDTTRPLPEPPVGSRARAASVWTGTEWVVWGGRTIGTDDVGEWGDGAAYDPATDTWRVIAEAPIGPRWVGGVWANGEMYVLTGARGPDDGPFALGDGAAYDPAADTWRAVADGPAHPGNQLATDGMHVFVYAKGGITVYDTATDEWQDTCCPTGYATGPLIWAGDRLLVLGGTSPYAVIEN